MCNLYVGIAKSDIFISSFLLSNYTIMGVIFSKILKKRIIVWEEFLYSKKSAKNVLKFNIRKIISQFVDAHFVMGNPQKKALMSMGVNESRIFVSNEYPGHIYNHVDYDEITKLKYLEKKRVILYIGRFIEIKGIEYLLNAYVKLRREDKNTFLLVVGYGSEENRLKKLADELKMKSICFYGPVFGTKKKSYLFNKIADIVAVPSIIDKSGGQEGGPLVVLEALSAGCPVVGTNALGNAAQFIQNGINGFIVPFADSNAFYMALKDSLRLLNTSFRKTKILETFNKIKDHNNQFEQIKNAIDFALRD